jgi:hypothetical protein
MYSQLPPDLSLVCCEVVERFMQFKSELETLFTELRVGKHSASVITDSKGAMLSSRTEYACVKLHLRV